MAKIYNGILDLNNEISIGFITPIQRIGDATNALSLKLKDYVDAVIEFCEYNSIPYLDLYRESGLTPIRPDFLAKYYISGDGTHPNNLGHKLFIAPKVIPFVEKLTMLRIK